MFPPDSSPDAPCLLLFLPCSPLLRVAFNQEVGQLLQQARVLMQHVLGSPHLAWLQCQGSLELAWLKQEVPEVTQSPDYR